MNYCVISSNTSFADYSAYVVSRHPSEQEALAACRNGEWVEELPEGLNAYDVYADEWVGVTL